MKFILDKRSGEFFNIDSIRTLTLSRIYDTDEKPLNPTKNFNVMAEVAEEFWFAILEEFTAEDEQQNFDMAKKYFDKLLADLNQKMAFILDDSGFKAVNVAAVKKISVECFGGDGGYIVCVTARLFDTDEEDEGIILKSFNSGDAEKDLHAAKEYLENLIETLNGGNL